MKILYATDLHGNTFVLRKLLELAKRKKVDVIIFGGDIVPNRRVLVFAKKAMLFWPVGSWYEYNPDIDLTEHGFFVTYFSKEAEKISEKEFEQILKLIPGVGGREQLKYWNGLEKIFEEFKHRANAHIFIMPGNDDFCGIEEFLDKSGAVKNINNKTIRLGDYFLTGYSYIPPTPFKFKGWEKPEKQIMKDLENLVKNADPKKTVFSIHIPPIKTNLDLMHNKEHVGSRAVRDFIEKHQPLLTMHGHVHESHIMSKAWHEKIGDTVCINPGDCFAGLRAVIITLPELELELITE